MNDTTLTIEYEFTLNDDPKKLESLQDRARYIDRDNLGSAQKSYSLAEAFDVVMRHEGTDWMVLNLILIAWNPTEASRKANHMYNGELLG